MAVETVRCSPPDDQLLFHTFRDQICSDQLVEIQTQNGFMVQSRGICLAFLPISKIVEILIFHTDVS